MTRSRLDDANASRQRMSDAAKKAFLARFRKECVRGLRGGVTSEELQQALDMALVQDVHES